MTAVRKRAPNARSDADWATFWGLGGIFALLVEALFRVTPRALEPYWSGELDGVQGLLYGTSIVTMALGEGYVGFQRNFSPRAVARAMALQNAPSRRRLFAPLYCMALIHATKRRLVINWALTLGIIALIVAVHHLDAPWRNIVDAGVVAGLLWGTVATLFLFAGALRGRIPACDLEHPVVVVDN